MITFGIVSDGKTPEQVNRVIGSIHDTMEGYGPYEILLIGPYKEQQAGCLRTIPFFSEPGGWITKKKNILTEKAQYDTIVYLHDYISFDKDWMKNWLTFSFNEHWDVGMNIIRTEDGKRFRDWCAWDDPRYGNEWVQHEPWCPPQGLLTKGKPCLVPYNYEHTERMYISGTFWLARKEFMLYNPLDERLYWGQAEDIEWSRRIRDKCAYKMNTKSICRLIKPKDVILPYVELTNE